MLTLNARAGRLSVAGRVAVAAAAIAGAGTVALAQPSPAPMYQIQDLGSLGGTTGTSAGLGLNDHGEVVGWSSAPATSVLAVGQRPFLWGPVPGTPGSSMRDLLPGVAGSGTATDRNEFGMSVGTFRHSNQDGPRGFVVGGIMTVVPPVSWIQPLQGGHATAANAINDSHTVVGSSTIAFGPLPPSATHAISWRNGQTTGLGTLGGTNSEALGINNPGTIVGVSDILNVAPTPTTRAVRRGFLIPFGTNQMQALSPLTPGGNSRANDISDFNLTVGSADFALSTTPFATNTKIRAVMWTPNTGSIVNLGTLRNTDHSSEALAVNSDSDIVGWSGSPFNAIAPNPGAAGPAVRAFLWRDGVMVDLNTRIPATAGWILHVASDANDEGQIVGWGTRLGNTATAPGRMRAFLLTPMPLDAADEAR